ncbi:MAG: hypothetical protein QOE06_346 [Thermoleophilaceae bacterium]|nr:hypothetical protein [Thermoleophilaceae bacterium]
MQGLSTGRHSLRLLAALAACAVALSGCGGKAAEKGARPANLPPDFNIELFNCADWVKAPQPERDYVVRRLREIVGGQITGKGANGHGSTLKDDQANQLFNGTCSGPKTRGFLLYKLYGHAAGFGGSDASGY